MWNRQREAQMAREILADVGDEAVPPVSESAPGLDPLDVRGNEPELLSAADVAK
jgi:hypothetical protein